MNKLYKTKDELMQTALTGKGIPFCELDKTNRLSSLKGGIGQMIEESLFEYKANSTSAPDIENLGIEIKVSPIVKKKDGTYKAKERMVLNIINYETENLERFEDSHFWFKNKEILMLFYEHNYDLPKEQWFIQEILDFVWPNEDLKIIKQDWKTITSKIKAGRAHELSESDTLYLGACTKGSTSENSYRNQPYSDIKAKQRAYSLKQSYVNFILNEYIFKNVKSEKIIQSYDLLNEKSFEEVIIDKVTPYIGKKQSELVDLLSVSPSKQTNNSIIRKIFKLNNDIDKSEEFKKANIISKTVRIESNGTIKESMSFPTMCFKDINKQSWEDSDFYNILSTTRFMFVIFKKTDNTEENSIFQGIKFWNMPLNDLEEAKECWTKTKEIIQNGVVLEKTDNGVKNNLPGQSENRIAHVRPHASKPYYFFDDYEVGSKNDGDELPDGRWMTKQCFWLNRSYIKSIISAQERV